MNTPDVAGIVKRLRYYVENGLPTLETETESQAAALLESLAAHLAEARELATRRGEIQVRLQGEVKDARKQLAERDAQLAAMTSERDELQRQVDGWHRTMSEALNTGNGSYRP